MTHGSAPADTSNSSSSVAKQKLRQASLERVLNELGQSGALKRLRAFDPSGGGAAVSFDWADRFMRHLKHTTLVTADGASDQPTENVKWSTGHSNCQYGSTSFKTVFEKSIASGATSIEAGATRLPAALLGEWSLVEQIGFEVGEFHR